MRLSNSKYMLQVDRDVHECMKVTSNSVNGAIMSAKRKSTKCNMTYGRTGCSSTTE